MKKVLLEITLCLLSAICFIYSVITCYYFFFMIVFILAGFLTLGGLIVSRYYTTNKYKRPWLNILFGVSLYFAIAAVGSLFYIYENNGDKVVKCITDKQTEKELGLLVAEYQQVNHVQIENVDIHSDMHVAYQSEFSVFNDRSKIDVYPEFYNFIVSMSGNKVVNLFDWRNKKLDISEGTVELTTIRNNDDGKPVYITGSRELVENIRTLPDTISFHIHNCQTKQEVDSLVFVKNKVFENRSIEKGSEKFSIARKRSLVDRIKDLYLID